MRKSDRKRLNRIRDEFGRGFEYLGQIKRGIAIFGSARTKPDNSQYKSTYELAYKLAKKKYSIITGAGKGLMEAANKGAYDAGGISVGLNIELPKFQDKNDYINHYIIFKHFYTRKVMFTKYSFASIACPGGYGTLDEIMDQFAVLQNEKIPSRPFILFGTKFYKGLIEWLRYLKDDKKINQRDYNLFKVTDSIEEVIDIIEKEYNGRRKRFMI